MEQLPLNAENRIVQQEIIDRFLAHQSNWVYVRSLSDRLESVRYLPDSTVRFWYNDLPQPYEPHWHTAFEMIAPVVGKYEVTVQQKTFVLEPGDILLIPGGELHSLHPIGNGSRFIFLFELEMLWQLKGAAYLVSCVSQPVLINRAVCGPIYDKQVELFNQLCLDYVQEGNLRELSIYTTLLNFLLNYGKYRLTLEGNASVTQFSELSQRNYAEKFSAVFAYMDKNFAEDLTLENVAAVAGFSKFHFSRVFKQMSGYNFYDYLCRRRIKAAETLLMKSGLSISQIALQSGFSSVSTFNRMFKKLKGCTPTRYRDMIEVRAGEYSKGDDRNA